ncbi:unnamed protein product [Prunus armeniaca]|uniref:Uncharacterized protein n=1 Tax=Prunus armeniaca TaxID=36596 RepID=A0A6J5VXV9_PRUAR|nr:unnamed protein product [Prunus armeniaca]CAB4292384.1 unnamed protein product [Prunus armeniaca]
MGLAVRQGHLAEGCSLAIVNFRRSRGRPTERTKELEPSLEIRFGILEFTGWVLVVRLSLSDLELFGARPSAGLGFGAGLSVAGVLGRAVLEQIWDWDVAKVGGAGLSL